jgi:hypothetical protein
MSYYRDKMRRAKALALKDQDWNSPAFAMLKGAKIVEAVEAGVVTHESLVFEKQVGQERVLSVDFPLRWISASTVAQIAAAFGTVVQKALAPGTPPAAGRAQGRRTSGETGPVRR